MPVDFQLEWKRDIHQRPPDFMAATDYGIIVAERHSRLVHVNKKHGYAIWHAQVNNQWGWLAVTDTCVAYLNPGLFLQCFNLETGETLWQRALARHAYGHLAAKDRYLIVGGWREYTRVTCLEITSCKRLWVKPMKHNYAPPIMSPWGIILAVHATDHQLRSLQLLDYEQGKIEFELDIPAKVQVTDRHLGIQLAGNTLYATTLDGGFTRWT